jgi:hypothetical protein
LVKLPISCAMVGSAIKMPAAISVQVGRIDVAAL